ncbi:MAG: transcriptional regulator, TetR family [Gammaproteobacteria bacterium]|jgi:AcrR family transcriptional regulator|nr:transcriptional regulator, TetR family [Gammaproteobacteria bacterium]
MPTRATQFRILQAALELFNEHGTAAVSSNRIAERCGISKGNLQYHFRNKREIIYALFQQAIGEMDAGWYRDHLAPTLEHMAAMFVRQLQLILKYRFFYRGMADLLRQDPQLRKRFADNRERRLRDLERFMLTLQSRGLMRFPPDPRRLRSIIDVTWIVNENWLNYMDYHDREVTVEAMLEGYTEILEVLRPYLCADPQQITQESYHTIERLAAQSAAEAGAGAAAAAN